MGVMLVALGAGVLAGVGSGGRLSNLARVRIRRWPLLGAALTGQLVAGAVPGHARAAVILACCAAVAAWCASNRAGRLLAGMAAFGLGLLANVVVIAANLGMPVSPTALREAGYSPSLAVARGHLYKHVVMAPDTVLRGLGDVVPLRWFHLVASPGDVVMLVGVLLFGWGATFSGGDTTGPVGATGPLTRRSRQTPATVEAAAGTPAPSHG